MSTVRFMSGNLLEAEAEALVNTVNCVGVMGKGIALEFKRRYPEMYRDYVERCRRGALKPGDPYIYPESSKSPQLSLFRASDELETPRSRIVVNFPTKDHWRSPSRIEWIEAGLAQLVSRTEEWQIESLAVPALGCGNGGLDWLEVGPRMLSELAKVGIPVQIFVPADVDPLHPFLPALRGDRQVA